MEFSNTPEWLRAEYMAEFEVPGGVTAKDQDGNEYVATVTVKDSIQTKVDLIDNKFTVTDKNGYTATYTVEVDGKVASSISVPITVSYNKYPGLKPLEYDTRLVYDIIAWDAPVYARKTQEEFDEVAEAGYNIIMPSFRKMDFGRDIQNTLNFLDMAHAAGLKSYAVDSDFCQFITQWNPPADNQPKLANKANVKYYIDHPAFLGLHICDEPFYRQFDLLASKVQQFKETFPEDKLIFINIWPRAAGSGNYGTTYDIYLHDYMEQVKPNILSYDHYPFDIQIGFWTDWFYALEEIKYKAMEYNVPVNTIMQVDDSYFAEKDVVQRRKSGGKWRQSWHSAMIPSHTMSIALLTRHIMA